MNKLILFALFIVGFITIVESCFDNPKPGTSGGSGEAASDKSGDGGSNKSDNGKHKGKCKGKGEGKGHEHSSKSGGSKSGGSKSEGKSSGKSSGKSGESGEDDDCEEDSGGDGNVVNRHGQPAWTHHHGDGVEHAHGVETAHALELCLSFTHTHKGADTEHTHPAADHNHDEEFRAAVEEFLNGGGQLEGTVSGCGGGGGGGGGWTFKGSGEFNSADGSFSATGELINPAGETVFSGEIQGTVGATGEFTATAGEYTLIGTGQDDGVGTISGKGELQKGGITLHSGEFTIQYKANADPGDGGSDSGGGDTGGGGGGGGSWMFKGSGQMNGVDGSFSATGELINPAGESVFSGEIQGTAGATGEFTATAGEYSITGTGQDDGAGTISGKGEVKKGDEVVHSGEFTIQYDSATASAAAQAKK